MRSFRVAQFPKSKQIHKSDRMCRNLASHAAFDFLLPLFLTLVFYLDLF